MRKIREIWLDNVKVIACILVVFGHFFQSMVKANVLPANDLYYWFEQTIYYFHVPLFFICSGYLYEKYSTVNSLNSWFENIKKKFVTLGIPYFIFSCVTWLLKVMFAGFTNEKVETGILETLFLKPISPYWYLYCLFFIFLVTPTFKRKVLAKIGFIVALGMKIIVLTMGGGGTFVIKTVMQNEVWFVIGMALCTLEITKKLKNWI